jgi:hypothetical protein
MSIMIISFTKAIASGIFSFSLLSIANITLRLAVYNIPDGVMVNLRSISVLGEIDP